MKDIDRKTFLIQWYQYAIKWPGQIFNWILGQLGDGLLGDGHLGDGHLGDIKSVG